MDGRTPLVEISRGTMHLILDHLGDEIESDKEDGYGKIIVEWQRGRIVFIGENRERKGAALLRMLNTSR